MQAGIMREIKRRVGDYSENDVIAERDKLVALWRAAHPEAAAEAPSGEHRPLMLLDYQGGDDPLERWANDVYVVTVRRREDAVFGTGRGMVQIGIHAHDGTARHDWREFQGIKNQIAGAECEGFELYPAESRLVDPSNYYTLWCFPGLKRLKVGVNEGRRVLDAGEAMAPQRGFS
jgi:hypothetical protein